MLRLIQHFSQVILAIDREAVSFANASIELHNHHEAFQALRLASNEDQGFLVCKLVNGQEGFDYESWRRKNVGNEVTLTDDIVVVGAPNQMRLLYLACRHQYNHDQRRYS